MQVQDIKECPLCHSKNIAVRFTCEDSTATHETFQLTHCQDCTFLFTNPQPNENAIGRYYESPNYISHSDSSKSIFDKVYTLAREISLKWKRKIVASTGVSGSQLLDVGCGTGNFLEHMKNNGWQTTGVEPSETAVAKSREKKIGVIYKSIFELGDRKFDVITLWHVLEHLHEPQQKLERLKNHLTENGTIIIAVPNRESYDAKYYKNHWAAYDVPRHLWHFSQENMKSILNQSGFHLTSTLPLMLDSFYVSLLSESYKNPTRNKISNTIAAFFIGLASNLKARKGKNYSSLIYIAKK